MAEYTVSDIIGVGFKYEQTAEETITPSIFGTRPVILGSANWGPVGSPVLITGGLSEFKNRFGVAGTDVDEGYEAALYAFKYTNQGYYTRLASSVTPPKRAYKEVGTAVLPAIAIGNLDLSSGVNLKPGSSITFDIGHLPAAASGAETLSSTIQFDSVATPIKSVGALIETKIVSSGTIGIGDTLEFDVYNESGTLAGTVLFVGNGETYGSASDLETVILSTVSGTIGSVMSAGVTGLCTVQVSPTDSTLLQITTEPYFYGKNSRIKIKSTTSGKFSFIYPLINREDFGLNVSLNSIISVINTEVGSLVSALGGGTLSTVYGSSFSFASTNLNNQLVLQTPSTGSESFINIMGETINGFSSLGHFIGETSFGNTGRVCGTFRSRYRGKDGNRTKVVVSDSEGTTPIIRIFFRDTLVSVIANYNFNPSSSEYLPTILSDSPILSQIIVYDHGKTFTDFNESDDNMDVGTSIGDINETFKITDGTYTLEGGDSGEVGIDITLDVLPEIVKYSNIDVYDIDIICAPGYPEEAVQNAMITDVADIRKDTWVVLDAPQITGSNAITNIIKWTNGTYTGRTNKLDSSYASVYFPYIKIRKTLYNSNNEVIRTLGDYSPTTRVISAFVRNDIQSGSRFTAPAGEIRLRLEDVEGIQTILTQSERDTLYGDIYDNVVNPIAFNIESGFFIGGQKTALRKNANGKLTSLSRVNVMRVGLYIKKEIQRVTKFFFHEPTDSRAQRDFATILDGICRFLVDKRAIQEDYRVICDETTNTPSITNNNGMLATIEITPTKTLERLKVVSTLKERVVTVTVSA